MYPVFNFPSIYSIGWVDFSQLFDPFQTFVSHIFREKKPKKCAKIEILVTDKEKN